MHSLPEVEYSSGTVHASPPFTQGRWHGPRAVTEGVPRNSSCLYHTNIPEVDLPAQSPSRLRRQPPLHKGAREGCGLRRTPFHKNKQFLILTQIASGAKRQGVRAGGPSALRRSDTPSKRSLIFRVRKIGLLLPAAPTQALAALSGGQSGVQGLSPCPAIRSFRSGGTIRIWKWRCFGRCVRGCREGRGCREEARG